MENEIKHENLQRNRYDQVEITIEDILADEEDNKNEVEEEFSATLGKEVQSCNSRTPKIKAEPQDECHGETIKDNFIIKTEIKEEFTNFNTFQDENRNWTDLVPHEVNIQLKTEECSESSNNSDHFTETYIKTEDNIGDYLNEVDLDLFNQQQDIEFKEHCINSDLSNEAEKTEDNIRPYECNLCDYKTCSKTSFAYHSSLHDEYSKLIWYYCTKCNYKTRQKGHLRRHYLTHQQLNKVKVFTCGICDYKFKQKCTLRRHIYNVHTVHKMESGSMIDQSFKCVHCSYTTLKRGLFLSHLDKHKDTRDVASLFTCDICSFSTKYRRNLRVHLETHKDFPELKTYECKLCKFKTRMGYSLKRHYLSKRHLHVVGKLEEYCPRTMKLKCENDS